MQYITQLALAHRKRTQPLAHPRRKQEQLYLQSQIVKEQPIVVSSETREETPINPARSEKLIAGSS